MAYASSLDTVGIIASTSGVVKKLFSELNWYQVSRQMNANSMPLDVLNAFDGKDPTAIPTHYRSSGRRLANLDCLRIGIPIQCFPSELSKESIQSLRHALQILRSKLNIKTFSVSIPSTTKALCAYYTIASAEASSNLAKYDGMRYGESHQGNYATIRSFGFGQEVKRRILMGTYALTAE